MPQAYVKLLRTVGYANLLLFVFKLLPVFPQWDNGKLFLLLSCNAVLILLVVIRSTEAGTQFMQSLGALIPILLNHAVVLALLLLNIYCLMIVLVSPHNIYWLIDSLGIDPNIVQFRLFACIILGGMLGGFLDQLSVAKHPAHTAGVDSPEHVMLPPALLLSRVAATMYALARAAIAALVLFWAIKAGLIVNQDIQSLTAEEVNYFGIAGTSAVAGLFAGNFQNTIHGKFKEMLH